MDVPIDVHGFRSTRFKSLIEKSLFILIVYSRPLADEVMWPNIWETVHNQNKNNSLKRETNTEWSKSRWGWSENIAWSLSLQRGFYSFHCKIPNKIERGVYMYCSQDVVGRVYILYRELCFDYFWLWSIFEYFIARFSSIEITWIDKQIAKKIYR